MYILQLYAYLHCKRSRYRYSLLCYVFFYAFCLLSKMPIRIADSIVLYYTLKSPTRCSFLLGRKLMRNATGWCEFAR